MKRIIMTTALCLVALVGCDKKDEPKPEDQAAKGGTTTSAASAAAATTTATAAPAPVALADSDLSTPADFEEAAEKSITAKNYKQELATLEGDIAKD